MRVFSFGEDGRVEVFGSEAEAMRACEPIDVESGVFSFYAEDGTWLRSEFSRPNRTFFGFALEQGEYRLVRCAVPEADPFEVALAETRGLEPNPYFASLEAIREHVRTCR